MRPLPSDDAARPGARGRAQARPRWARPAFGLLAGLCLLAPWCGAQTARFANGLPAGETISAEEEGLRVRGPRGETALIPWEHLSPATRFRHQAEFRDRVDSFLAGRPLPLPPGPPGREPPPPAGRESALLVYEGFDGYAAGELTGQGDGLHSGGFGNHRWTHPWGEPGTVLAESLRYGPLATRGGALRFGARDHQAAHRHLDPPLRPGPGDVFWISHLVRYEAEPQAGPTFSGLRWMTGAGARGYWQGKGFRQDAVFGLDRPPAASGRAMPPGTTHLLVQRIEIVRDEARGTDRALKWLWVNPAHGTLGGADPDPGTADIAASPHDLGDPPSLDRFTTLCIENSSAHGGFRGAVFDEIRLGRSFADVTPVETPGPPAR